MEIVTCLKYFFMTRRHIAVLMGAALLLLSLGASCKEDPPKEPGYCQKYPGQCETIMEAKSYFLFNVGSWWVYEEETTHERDSLYVIEYANDPDSPDFDCTIFSEREDMRYHYFPLISSGPGCSNDAVSSNKCIYIKRSKGNFGNYIGEDNCFFIQYYKGAYTGVTNINYPDAKITVAEVYQDYEINDLMFGRTIQIFEDHTFIENNNPTNHFFSKNVGLVRKELLDSNQVWNLVSYNIAP